MGCIRAAKAADAPQLLLLWALLHDEGDPDPTTPWKKHAREWFIRSVDDRANACFPVIEVDGKIFASAIRTLAIGVPNPHCSMDEPCGLRTSSGCQSTVATPDGQRIYEKAGFILTRAPRMKLGL